MRRYLVAGPVVAALALPAFADAKGPVSASISGPALARTLAVTGETARCPGTRSGTLAERRRLFRADVRSVAGPDARQPAEGHARAAVHGRLRRAGAERHPEPRRPGRLSVREAGRADVHEARGSSFWDGEKAHGGWYPRPTGLKQMLVRAGLAGQDADIAVRYAGAGRASGSGRPARGAGVGCAVAGADEPGACRMQNPRA